MEEPLNETFASVMELFSWSSITSYIVGLTAVFSMCRHLKVSEKCSLATFSRLTERPGRSTVMTRVARVAILADVQYLPVWPRDVLRIYEARHLSTEKTWILSCFQDRVSNTIFPLPILG
jgi:hypothetical protein